MSLPPLEIIWDLQHVYMMLSHVESPEIGEFEDCRLTLRDFLDSCHGSGLTSAILSTFPELEQVPDLGRLMDIAEARSPSEAVMSFQTALGVLQEHCKCSRCSEECSRESSGRTCLSSIAYTILQLARSLGCVERDPDLSPTITGIRHVYTNAPSQVKRPYVSKKALFELLDLHAGPIDRCFNFPVILFSGVPLTIQITGARQVDALRGQSGLTAVSCRGICYYLDALRQLSSSPSHLRTVHIMPGHIQKEARQYDAVLDHPMPADGDTNSPRTLFSEYNACYLNFSSPPPKSELKATVLEQAGTRELRFSYTICLLPWKGTDSHLAALRLPPGFLTQTILEASGLIACAGNPRDCPKDLAIAHQTTPRHQRIAASEEGCGLVLDGDIECCISSPKEDDVDRCIAIVLNTFHSIYDKLFIRRGECLPCCMRAVVRDSAEMMKGLRLTGMALPQRKTVFRIIDTQSVLRLNAK